MQAIEFQGDGNNRNAPRSRGREFEFLRARQYFSDLAQPATAGCAGCGRLLKVNVHTLDARLISLIQRPPSWLLARLAGVK
jgi:hypothetical protein